MTALLAAALTAAAITAGLLTAHLAHKWPPIRTLLDVLYPYPDKDVNQ